MFPAHSVLLPDVESSSTVDGLVYGKLERRVTPSAFFFSTFYFCESGYPHISAQILARNPERTLVHTSEVGM